MLKQAIQDKLPQGILDRPKAGFGAPIRSWIVEDSKDMVQDILFGETTKQRGLFNVTATEQLFQQTASGRVDGAYTLLSMLMIELWCREFTAL